MGTSGLPDMYVYPMTDGKGDSSISVKPQMPMLQLLLIWAYKNLAPKLIRNLLNAYSVYF